MTDCIKRVEIRPAIREDGVKYYVCTPTEYNWKGKPKDNQHIMFYSHGCKSFRHSSRMVVRRKVK